MSTLQHGRILCRRKSTGSLRTVFPRLAMAQTDGWRRPKERSAGTLEQKFNHFRRDDESAASRKHPVSSLQSLGSQNSAAPRRWHDSPLGKLHQAPSLNTQRPGSGSSSGRSSSTSRLPSLVSSRAESPRGPSSGDLVMLQGLRARTELNGKTGRCVQWSHETGRWDVELETLEKVSVRPGNLCMHTTLGDANAEACNPGSCAAFPGSDSIPALPSNNGWRGKTCHSWIFDDQESISVDKPKRLITVHATATAHGDKTVCTNMAGEEEATIGVPFCQATFSQVYAACGYNRDEAQLLTSSGHELHGLDHWTLATAAGAH